MNHRTPVHQMLWFKFLIVCTPFFSNPFVPSPLCVGEIVELNDATFEHQTQASTGATTGSWLIMFKANKCTYCKKMMPEFESLSENVELKERGTVFARVDVPSNRQTTARFGIRGFPTLIYLHKSKVYRYKGKRTYDDMLQFIREGHLEAESSPVPPPPTALDQFLEMVDAIKDEMVAGIMGKSGPAGVAMVLMLLIMSILIVGTVGFILFLFCATSEAKKKN